MCAFERSEKGMEFNMKVLDNRINKFGDDLKEELKVGDKCNIASAVFSMYSYQELKNQLNSIDEFTRSRIMPVNR